MLCVIIYFELKNQTTMTNENYCKDCGDAYPSARKQLGWLTCLICGELAAKLVKHCIVPMHKSNYVPVTNLEDLKGINSKGGWYR